LWSDFDYSQGINFINSDITLDLNGYTMNVATDDAMGIYLHNSSLTLVDPSNGSFNLTGKTGAYLENNSTLEVSNLTSTEPYCAGGEMASGSTLTVYKDVTATTGYGIDVEGDGNIVWVHGAIMAWAYLSIKGGIYYQSDGVEYPDILPGYLLYSDGSSNVWVKKPIDLSTATVTIPAKAWTGKQIKPTAITYNGVSYPFSANTSSATYGTNKNIGKGTVKITGQGHFVGTKTITFQIVPKTNKITKITAAKKSMKVTWTKVSNTQKVTGYQVHYRVKGKTTWKTKTFTSKYSSATIKSLLKGKKYQVQVRSYKTVSGVKYYSAWSAVKTSAAIK